MSANAERRSNETIYGRFGVRTIINARAVDPPLRRDHAAGGRGGDGGGLAECVELTSCRAGFELIAAATGAEAGSSPQEPPPADAGPRRA